MKCREPSLSVEPFSPLLTDTAARVGAVAKLRRADFYWSADQACLRFTEKGGKSRETPVRNDLQQFIVAYIESAGIRQMPAR